MTSYETKKLIFSLPFMITCTLKFHVTVEYLNDQMKTNRSALEVLEDVPRSQRAKSVEEHYGRTIDLGFRYLF